MIFNVFDIAKTIGEGDKYDSPYKSSEVFYGEAACSSIDCSVVADKVKGRDSCIFWFVNSPMKQILPVPTVQKSSRYTYDGIRVGAKYAFVQTDQIALYSTRTAPLKRPEEERMMRDP